LKNRPVGLSGPAGFFVCRPGDIALNIIAEWPILVLKKKTWHLTRGDGRMKRILMLSMMMGLVAGLTVAGLRAKEKCPAHTTKEVMTAVKGGLLKHVLEETATPEQRHIFLEYVKALPDNKPPKGDASSWQAKTRELIKATRAVVRGREGAIERLTKASNCKACHSVHKVYPPETKK
jgi:hypothetical protein